MKIGLLLGASLPLFLFAACGGDADQSQAAAKGPADRSGAAAGGDEASSDKSTPAETEQAPTRKRTRRPRVNFNQVKILFANETPAPEPRIPSSEELVALGEALYHTESLSKNGNLSCASCHDLSKYGVDGKPTSSGSDGKNGERNSPTTYNASRQFVQFWDGRAASVEEQAVMPMLDPVEHAIIDEDQLVTKIKAQPDLVAGFEKAFPGADDPITPENFGNAIGAFERTLVTRSKWDDYLDGNQRALDNDELLGLKTFIEVGCTTCHINRALGGHMFQKAGLLKPYPSDDTGRMQVTKLESDKFMFKVPTLLNVEKTAPYYHDGKIETLREAVVLMADMQLGKKLTDEQVDAILAFLKATTGELPERFAKK